MTDTIYLKEIETRCIIGIFPRERRQRQRVVISLRIPCNAKEAAKRDRIEAAVDYKGIAKSLLAETQKSRFYLIESLAEHLAAFLIKRFALPSIDLTVSKPGAVRYSRDVGVRITRVADRMVSDSHGRRRVYLSGGSNVNKEVMTRLIAAALRETFEVIRFSGIYETPAMGGSQKQGPFWNFAAEISTSLKPSALKRKLLTIERKLGRKRGQDKFAPRTVDLDILFYGEKEIKEGGVRIPHPDTRCQPYVLIPMVEIAPTLRHPQTHRTLLEMVASRHPRWPSIRFISNALNT